MHDAVDRPARRGTPADARWRPRAPRALVEVGDLGRIAARFPLALSLAGAAARDPRAFRLALLAIRRHGALQKPLELFEYIRYLRRRPVVCCLEIGVAGGGTFFAHAAVTAPGGHVIAIDAHPQPGADDMSARCRALARPSQAVTCLWRDSHDEATAAMVTEALGGAPLDVLFLDGDHGAEGIARDFALYAPLVRAGGLVAFHDIATEGGDTGVPAFWRALAAHHEHVEFVDHANAPHGLGIGVLVKD